MVIVLDNICSSYEWIIPPMKNVMFVEGDVVNDIDLKQVFNGEPSIVFQLAAFLANQNSILFKISSQLLGKNDIKK